MKKELVIVLDFGGQYNQLVARRVRECNVYCEIYSYKTDIEKIKEMNPKGILDGTMVLYTIVRLILIPAILFGLTALLPIPALLRGITVIIAGMPTPVTTALLSAKYHGNEGYATGMIFVTTILSLFTLPVWCWLLG